MELGELVTSGTGAALVQGSLVESHHHGVSIFLIFFFFSHRNKQSHVKSITPWIPVCSSQFFRRRGKKTQQNFSPKSDSFTLVVSKGFYTFSVLTFPQQVYPSAI